MMGPTEVLNLVASGFTILGASIGAGISRAYTHHHNKRLLQERRAILNGAAVAGELFIAVGVGGQGQPEDDVAAYIRANHPAIQSFLVYQSPPIETLGEPDTALQVAEDLRSWVDEFGRVQIVKVHFFPAGMLAYPFLMGALLRNMTTVIVYQKSNRTLGSYVPLYEWSGTFATSHKRRTKSLAKMRTVSVSDPAVPAKPSQPAVAAPAIPPAIPPPAGSSPPPSVQP